MNEAPEQFEGGVEIGSRQRDVPPAEAGSGFLYTWLRSQRFRAGLGIVSPLRGSGHEGEWIGTAEAVP